MFRLFHITEGRYVLFTLSEATPKHLTGHLKLDAPEKIYNDVIHMININHNGWLMEVDRSSIIYSLLEYVTTKSNAYEPQHVEEEFRIEEV